MDQMILIVLLLALHNFNHQIFDRMELTMLESFSS